MKKLLFIIAIGFLFASCGTKKNKHRENTSNVITVSILPQKTFVEKITGTDFKINVLIPPGASPVTYSLLPSQLKDLARSAVWFRIGYIGFEHSWKDKIAATNPKMKVVNLSENLNLIAPKNHQHNRHLHSGGIDPHTWLSPQLVKQMSKKILDEILLINPEKAAEYKTNYQNFVQECDKLNAELKKQLEPYKNKTLVVFHPGLSYYARDYGLKQYSLETEGKEPTPRQLKKLIELARKENIGVIYVQSQFDREHARVFANEIQGKVQEIDPLSTEWEKNLQEMTNTFIQNF